MLTRDDVGLEINDPAAPKVLCLGGDVSRAEALGPILSLYIDRLNRLINRPGRYRCAQLLDEFPVVRAASVLTTAGVGREHDIITFLVIQDLNQLRLKYSRTEADMILNMMGNLICGQVGGETARWVSERFPSVTHHKKMISVNSSDVSISRSEMEVGAISPSTLATLSSGEFVGIVADEPGHELKQKAWHGRILRSPSPLDTSVSDLPVVRQVTDQMIQENFRRIKHEVQLFVSEEVGRIAGDPAMREWLVRR